TANVEATLAAAAGAAPGTAIPEKPTTGFKTQVTAQAKSSTTAVVATTFGSTETQPPAPEATASVQTNAAPQPAINGKPDNDNAPAKPDGAVGTAAPDAAAPSPRDHAAVTANAQATVAPDAGAQATALAAPTQTSTFAPITTASLTAAPAAPAAGAPVPV